MNIFKEINKHLTISRVTQSIIEYIAKSDPAVYCVETGGRWIYNTEAIVNKLRPRTEKVRKRIVAECEFMNLQILRG